MATRAASQGAAKKPAKRNGNPRKQGRPHDLDKPVLQPNGTIIEAAEAIVRQLRTGLPLGESALSVGVDRSTAYRWRGDGAATRAALLEQRLQPTDLTDYQHAVVAFYDSATRAEAEAEALNATRLASLARGGHVTTRELIEYDASDNVVSRKVTTATLPPDPKAVMFWLERRAPERWGRSQRIEHALGADGPRVATESPLERIQEALGAIERRKDASRRFSVVDTESEEEDQSA